MPISTGTAQVVPDPDDPRAVTLLVNGVPSSHLDLDAPERLAFEYMQQMAVVLERVAPAGEPLRVLHLGAAGCALARAVDAVRPGSQQLAVELDALLAEHVRTWFDLPRSPALRLRVGEASAVLATRPDASADVVVRDAFAGDRTPEHLTTRGFTAEVARVLRPGGVYLANAADGAPLERARREAATVAACFAHLGVVVEPGLLRGRGRGNLVLVGTDRDDLLGAGSLARAVRSLPAPARLLVGPEAAAFVGTATPLEDPPAPAA